MSDSPLGAHRASPAELSEQLAADRRGEPYVLWRDDQGAQHLLALDGDAPSRLWVGRDPGCAVLLPWDGGVSRVHAQLERLGAREWAVVDDGLSRNGTFVNGERLRGRRRLADGDVVRVGATAIGFRAPLAEAVQTLPVGGGSAPPLSPAQKRVLVALCRPLRDDPHAAPATNQGIADELFLSVEAVKTHLRTLFERFEVQDLARNAKRGQLVRRALQTGAITPADLDG